MLTSARKGIPSTQMARELGITQKTAWFLAQRIRKTWLKDKSNKGNMGNHTQVDGTYVGGKEKNKHAKDELHARRGAVGKTAVVGMLDENRQVRAMPITNTKAATLKGFISQNAPVGATVVTDNFPAYGGLNRIGYAHKVVNHSISVIYLRGAAHTNGIESFWALLKRGHYGIYHHMSAKHLHRYERIFVPP